MAISNLTAFKIEFQGDVVVPADRDYAAALTRWATSAERLAQVVAFAKDSEDVVRAIEYAKSNDLAIAIRGGGHNPSGASSSEGLVIDLSRYINSVTVDPDNKLAHIGGGALWEDVDKATMKHGLAGVAGTVRNIGVGGYTLGGGLGWLTPAHGLAVDNLVKATVVTAHGEILVASESENSELFWGIRGGGCNFGVVTEFTFRIHPQRPTVYSGLLFFPISAVESIVNTTNKWFPQASEKEAMMHEYAVMPDGTPVIRIAPFYNGPEAEGREKFKNFFDIGPIADYTMEIPYDAINADLIPGGKDTYMTGIRQAKYDAGFVKKCLDISVEAFKENKMLSLCYFEFVPLNKVNSIPGNETAFRRVPSQGVSIMIQWDGESILSPSFDFKNREEMMEKARIVAHKLGSTIVSSQPETGEPFYLGYSNVDCDPVVDRMYKISDKSSLTFGKNYARLQRIKKRYDPDNIFHKWFPITPSD